MKSNLRKNSNHPIVMMMMIKQNLRSPKNKKRDLRWYSMNPRKRHPRLLQTMQTMNAHFVTSSLRKMQLSNTTLLPSMKGKLDFSAASKDATTNATKKIT